MIVQEAPNRLRSFSASLQGLLLGSVLMFFALINLDLGGVRIGFFLVPVIGIYLWPMRASYSWSLLFIFILGFLHDIASTGPMGVWAICYLLLFVIIGGGVNAKIPFQNAFGGFFLSLVFVSIVAYILGYISLGRPPMLSNFVASVLLSLMLFPIFFWLRNLFGHKRSTTIV